MASALKLEAVILFETRETFCQAMTATDTHATKEELIEAVCSVRSVPSLYIEGRLPQATSPFVNHVKYLGVIFDKTITWRLHIEMIEAKAFRTIIRIYSLQK
jgi:hypothetical protein